MIDPGLCGRCANARIIESRRGSRFHRCELSRVDPRYPRYPALPVLRCAGHEPGEPMAPRAAPDTKGEELG